MSAILQINQVEHAYQKGKRILRGMSLDVMRGQIACLLGPSGCGKTTALRILAGFEDVEAGEVVLNGQSVNRPGFTLQPEKRSVGIVFQDAALFPHLNLAANVGFGLRGMPAPERKHKVDELLALVSLDGLGKRFPHELSGGQKQRAALARAMAPDPTLILLDEPFANLDACLREKLSSEVRRLLRETGKTAVLVTHDQNEAFAMADLIAVMNEGRILQTGSAAELYHHPVDPFVAAFIGEGDLIPGTIHAPNRVRCALGDLPIEQDFAPGTKVQLLIRPECLVEDESGKSGEVLESHFRGQDALHVISLNEEGVAVKMKLPTSRALSPGDSICVAAPTTSITLFPTGRYQAEK